MCLGIPGRVVAIEDPAALLATIDIAGVRRTVNVACVAGEELCDLPGAWVLVHAGFAMSRIDEAEAARTLRLLESLGDADEALAALRASRAAPDGPP